MSEGVHLLPAARGLSIPLSPDLESLRATASCLATLVDSVQAGALMEDEECRVILVNRAFCEMFGIPEGPDDLVGWETRTILGWTSELFVESDAFFPRIETLVTERRRVLSEELALRDGRTFERDYIPVFTAGDYQGHFWVFRDITSHKRTEIELRKAAQRLELANRTLAAANRTLEGTNRRMDLLNELGDLLQTAESRDEGVGVLGSVLPRIFESFAGAVYLEEADPPSLNAVVSWGSPPPPEGSLRVTDCWALRRGRPHPADPAGRGPLCPHAEAGAARGTLCIPMMAHGGTLGLLHLRQSEDAGGDGEGDLVAIRHLAFNTAEQLALGLVNLELRHRLREQALRDSLTGLYNRRHLEDRLGEELRRAYRAGAPLAILLLDLDRFKEINDAHGHAAGDQILTRFAAMLQEIVRTEDVVARYGGEEFTVILPGADTAAAVRVAETLRRRTRRLVVQVGAERVRGITVSVGVSSYPASGETADELMAAADAALYLAKDEGRDRVVTAGACESSGRDDGEGRKVPPPLDFAVR